MKGRKGTRKVRDRTDASLGAERQITDNLLASAAHAKPALVDEILAREKLSTDKKLERIRLRADAVIEENAPVDVCGASKARPSRGGVTKIERRATDVAMEGERTRIRDVIEEFERIDVPEEAIAERRDETNRTLAGERDHADGTVTLLRESEQARSAAQSELTRRRQIFGMVSHELRNALAVIGVNAQLLCEAVSQPDLRALADDTSVAAAQMARLVNDLLDVAGVESGAFRIEARRGDVASLLEDVRLRYASLFQERSVTLVVDVGAATSIEAIFDRDRLVQVLSNILGNALKFTPAGGTVTMSAAARGSDVEVCVQDTGTGIPREAADKVFDRFWQAEQAPGKGFGLGLYIAKCIVETHGGRIHVDTTPSATVGTTIRFTLPLPDEDALNAQSGVMRALSPPPRRFRR